MRFAAKHKGKELGTLEVGIEAVPTLGTMLKC
jgi:hypothetical protein